ncbi:DUF2399 domain-containing protein [Blastococcus sp. MG754426]|uniref:DUF2399 domain-containing protein n=1 Tax=unclassified Blastococcus TaxID=2619396 RepID=UPI001EF14294|nr:MULTISPECIES: DUF2399 domain-containing protein [unclassified Blastococcus]MCF6509186.1 DUF2399 domain-containing protein [Blastococcus sp. MG754426]MCF6513723.1 DUF2399 domain-containing protein [Blastococcus sp. MG754427]
MVADGAGWRVVPDRRRRLRLTAVALTAADDVDAPAAPDPAGADASFVLGAARRTWAAVQRRFGARAWPLAEECARAGLVAVCCTVTEDMRLGAPTGWHLLDRGARLAQARASAVTARREQIEQRRDDLLTRLVAAHTDGDPVLGISSAAAASLVHALRHETGRVRRLVLLAAATDLLDGVTHDGPRAFSLAHFADSKIRDDALGVLADAGVDAEVAIALGLRRAPRLGVAGAVDAERAGTRVALSALDGPVLIRADQPDLTLISHAEHLVIVENLQAAEALAERVAAPGTTVAVVYTAGTPSAAALDLLVALMNQVPRVLLCPDADLGGVRIAAAVLDALPAEVAARVILCDPGEWPHRRQRPWPIDGATVQGLRERLDGSAGRLAGACLARGYRVEQEDTVRVAVEHWLATGRARPV